MGASGGSGGWVWHWRAVQRRARWHATRQALADWLHGLDLPSGHLVLIGASAGWMMPDSWLAQFRRIDAYDLDPWASALFRLNHGRALRASRTTLRFHRRDAIAGLAAILAEHPGACVLFDNILGQLCLQFPEPAQAERRLSSLLPQLAGRSWGSIHDLYSGPLTEAWAQPAVQHCTARRTLTGLAGEGRCDADFERWLLAQSNACGEWLDHLTGAVFPAGHACRLIWWPLAPRYGHWLQAGWHHP